MKKRVLVIGAGPGGLTSGMLLAHRGYDVTILEKADRVGGRSAPITVGPYTFDTGPTFLHQKFTLDEIFAETGRKADDYIRFQALDPMTRLTWGDVSMDTSPNQETMNRNIEAAFPGEAKNYNYFMEDHAEKLRVIFPCLQKPYHELRSYLDTRMVKALPYVITTRSVMDVLGDYFTDDRLKLAFTFQAKYLGMSPWKCPALFSILSYIEYAHGIYHIEGGLCQISVAMAKVFEEEGGTLQLGAEVAEVCYEGKKVSGVRLADDTFLPCDELVVNADYAQARSTIFGKNSTSAVQLKKKKFSCSTFMLYLGLDKVYEDEPHHHIIFADDYAANVADIQSESRVSDDMSIYVRNSSINDKTVAPEGHSQLYILCPTINNRNGYPWEENQAAYREKLLDRIIAKTGMKDLREHIVEERCLTPQGWEDADVFMGATFNFSHTLDQMMYLRPRNRLEGFRNVYLVGGGTHPGSGLPTIYESGRISANLICQSYGVERERVDFASEILRKAIA
jgi:phytoene desaturase